jgi:TRAP-type mannitol/chloroaromatic compound transport system permease large subunit
MAPNIELRDVFYGCVPFVVLELMIVALLIAFPQIALFAVSD